MSTLFSYFKPVSANTPDKKDTQKSKLGTPTSKGNGENRVPLKTTPTLPRKRVLSDDDEDGHITIPVRKNLSGRPKRKACFSFNEQKKVNKKPNRIVDSDNSDTEYVPAEEDESVDDVAEDSMMEESMEVIPKKKRPLESKKSTPRANRYIHSPATPTTPMSSSAMSIGTPTTPTSSSSTKYGGKYLHETLDWLKDENRRDKMGRKITDPDHDPRTLLVSRAYLNSLSPAMRQWWEMKSDNFDTVLFFKVGKFYEFYHMDAVLGVQELNLVYMKGDFAHSGFPEVAFGRYAQTLVQKGYKVARVEQTETPAMMELRVQRMPTRPTKFDKVVRREMCALISKGTRTIGFFEGEDPESESAYLLAIKEKIHSNCDHEFGVCFIDTCIGTFHMGQFSDDRQCSRLRTLIAHYPPSQVLYERANLSSAALTLVSQLLPAALKDCLASGSEFWSATKTLKILVEDYFSGDDGSVEDILPSVLKNMLSEDDSLGLSPKDSHELCISSLGACVWTLKRALIEHEVLALKDFSVYIPPDHPDAGVIKKARNDWLQQRMVLDDVTLINLDVIINNMGGCYRDTLLDKIDHCSTMFGRRLLKQWLCSPLCNPVAINDRLDAIADLLAAASLVVDVKDILKTLPDMERLVRRAHTLGCKKGREDHPQTRAILFEEKTYSKKKICDFIALLQGLQASLKIVELFSCVESFTSRLLSKLVTMTTNGGMFPDMREQLQVIEASFDRDRARKSGTIDPKPGVNTDYDNAVKDIEKVKQDLQDYLARQRKRLGCKTIVYWGTGRNRYQLEVPDSCKNIPRDYDLKSQKKGAVRYWTSDIVDMVAMLTQGEERRDAALRDTLRCLFHSFGEHIHMWESAIECVATLDVLVSMATYSAGIEGCRPQVVSCNEPYITIVGGRHPCVTHTFTGDDFIPNDIAINSDKRGDGKLCLVVTGPNMGGKSTLMRQTGLIVILAQLGCHVPALSCSLSPVDRIFTRLGASDHIMQGESTFMVELSETSVILQHSTGHSLVLLDELGRGTATYDGTAIASAVVNELIDKRCRTMFSTHYHSLVEELGSSCHVQLGHMACMVEHNDDGSDCEETIIFLYKFIDGACPKSYGFNAAKLAGIPAEVITVAKQKASELESAAKRLQLFRKFWISQDATDNLEALKKEINMLF